MSNQKIIARHKARESALQGIYQWQCTNNSPTEIELQFQLEQDMASVDVPYFSELLHNIPKHIHKIDSYLEKVIDRSFKELNPVELAVMRIAVYELLFRSDVPYKVIINEALQITKTYGAKEGFKYVNGVLDTLAKELRPLEVTLAKEKSKPKKPE